MILALLEPSISVLGKAQTSVSTSVEYGVKIQGISPEIVLK